MRRCFLAAFPPLFLFLRCLAAVLVAVPWLLLLLLLFSEVSLVSCCAYSAPLFYFFLLLSAAVAALAAPVAARRRLVRVPPLPPPLAAPAAAVLWASGLGVPASGGSSKTRLAFSARLSPGPKYCTTSSPWVLWVWGACLGFARLWRSLLLFFPPLVVFSPFLFLFLCLRAPAWPAPARLPFSALPPSSAKLASPWWASTT